MRGKKKRLAPRRSYAAELQAKKEFAVDLIQTWTAQLALDTIAMVLNDPEIMGSDVFGAKRLERVCGGFNKLWPDHLLALSKHDEAEYWRTKIDQAQARIFGPKYLHWQERYPWWDQKDSY